MRAPATFIAIVCFCSSLVAQKKGSDTTTRTVQGMVTDAAHHPVAQAVVQLKNSKTGLVWLIPKVGRVDLTRWIKRA